jgi:hypothetical protein
MKPLCLTILVALPVLLCYLPYGVFPDWSYLRFLLPAFPLAFMTIGALVVNASQRLPAALRGPVLLVALAAACSTNVLTAAREYAFSLELDASRYRTAGRYLDAALRKAQVVCIAAAAPAREWAPFVAIGATERAAGDRVRAAKPFILAGAAILLLATLYASRRASRWERRPAR